MKFDWVIIDTPPVALLPDAGLLAAMAEAAVLVVIGAARTPFDIIQRTVDTIGPRQDHGRGAEPRGDGEIQQAASSTRRTTSQICVLALTLTRVP